MLILKLSLTTIPDRLGTKDVQLTLNLPNTSANLIMIKFSMGLNRTLLHMLRHKSGSRRCDLCHIEKLKIMK